MTWLLLSMIPSGAGFVLFTYGRKQQRWPLLAGGLAYMVYPYFTASITAMLAIGVGLGVALYLTVRAGY